MPIDEEPIGPVVGPIGKQPADLDKKERLCYPVEDLLGEDPDARERRLDEKDLEDSFDPDFDEEPDAWDWE